MKKKWWLIGLATLAICGGLAVAITSLQPDGVTKANFDRILEGMTRSDVESIFGRRSHGIVPTYVAKPGEADCWARDDGARAEVAFREERISWARWTESTETIPAKLLRWLSFPRK